MTDSPGHTHTYGPDVRVVCSSRVFFNECLGPATLVISRTTGKIIDTQGRVIAQQEFPPDVPYSDFSPYIILPGLVDTHVHLNEPGRTEWEGFYTGTQAAASGGVTTVIDMPLNSIPPTTSVEALEKKARAARDQIWVDVGFYGGVIPSNVGKGELKSLVRSGVKGFKAFLIDSGVYEFPAIDAEGIKEAMMELADEPTTLMFHAEMIPPTAPGEEVDVLPVSTTSPTKYSKFLSSRPPSFESSAIKQIISLAECAPNLPLHIVHLSAAQGIPLLREARSYNVKITAETCFHYLTIAAEDIPDRDTRYKCCPPIREQINQEILWDELLHKDANGVIKTVVSDHSPCTPNLKLLPKDICGAQQPLVVQEDEATGDFLNAWGGISSVGLGLPILWTELSRRNPGMLADDKKGRRMLKLVVDVCCVNPAKQVGLQQRKGRLAVGYDADFCVFDDVTAWTLQPDHLLFRNKCSPYQGKRLQGMVIETWLRGECIFVRDNGYGSGRPTGKLLLDQRTC